LEGMLSKANGFYAWGATPGPQNIPRWNRMKVGDYVLCVYDNIYHYVARLLGRYDNERFARSVWGENDEGETWQYLYFLTKPQNIDVPVRRLGEYLHKNYMGFTEIPEDKLERIVKEFQSVDNFINAVILKRKNHDPVTVEFADIIKLYHNEGIVFRSATQGVRYYISTIDETGCTVTRIDANEPERVTFEAYTTKRKMVEENGGQYRFNDLDSTAAKRSTYLQALPFGLSADHETILDLSDESKGLQILIDVIRNLNVDRSSGEPRLYKPAVVYCVVEGIDKGELPENKIQFEWVSKKFKGKMRALGEEVGDDQAAMAFFLSQTI